MVSSHNFFYLFIIFNLLVECCPNRFNSKNDNPNIIFNNHNNFRNNDDLNQRNFLSLNHEEIPELSFHKNNKFASLRNMLRYTEEIQLKQGKIKGIVRNFMTKQPDLSEVYQFLGIPYAEPPIQTMRFMPPGAPLPWNGLKLAIHYPPVCPQNLPLFKSSKVKISAGRYDQFDRLLPYLQNESEDCLYLNVYVSKEVFEDKAEKHPVLVYIHGESYEWNSGNPYDGSVLSSYSKLIVVTLNYRLGVFGFLKVGINQDEISNYGLLDQVAALQWITDNIGFFNGDRKKVTLMGHSTGAALVNFLMVSPVAAGLFHRAILMSGSAMSDWASTNNTLPLSMELSNRLNCSLANENIFLNCLRTKSYQDIMAISITLPPFVTVLGPTVDGFVIPNHPYKLMNHNSEIFKRYELLFGMTEAESYHILDAFALRYGLKENQRDQLLNLFLRKKYETRPDLAFAATINRYIDLYNNPSNATQDEHRDVVLDILSDSRTVAPLVQTGLFHADGSSKNYMYVFGHISDAGQYKNLQNSVVGEELPYIFGAPLAPCGPFQEKYTFQEKLLSEAVMLYWSNFARNGNPKSSWRENFLHLHPMEWDRYDIDWPQFNKKSQCFLNIGIPPSLGYKYRQIYMNYWNKELPEELNHIDNLQSKQPVIHYTSPAASNPTSVTSNNIFSGTLKKYDERGGYYTTESSVNKLKKLLRQSTSNELSNPNNMPDNIVDSQETLTNRKEDNPSNNNDMIVTETYDIFKSESTMYFLVGLILIFFVLNLIVYSVFIIKRKKLQKNKLSILSYRKGFTTAEMEKRFKHLDYDENHINLIKGTKNYETMQINNFTHKTKPLSNPWDIDTHGKVSDWILQDVSKKKHETPKSSIKSNSSLNLSFEALKRYTKISIGIDATPQNRSDSVLRQEPIEITKLKKEDPFIICEDIDVCSDFMGVQNYDECYENIRRINEQVTSFIDADNEPNSSVHEKEIPTDIEPKYQLRNNNDYFSNTSTFKRQSLPLNSFNKIYAGKQPPSPPPRTVSTLGRKFSKNYRISSAVTTSPLMLAKNPDEEGEPQISENTLIVGPLLPKKIYPSLNRRMLNRENLTYVPPVVVDSLRNQIEPQAILISSNENYDEEGTEKQNLTQTLEINIFDEEDTKTEKTKSSTDSSSFETNLSTDTVIQFEK